jgi:amino acid transporter
VGSDGVGFFTALVAALWAFDGWADLNFLAEDLKDLGQMTSIMGSGLLSATLAYLVRTANASPSPA